MSGDFNAKNRAAYDAIAPRFAERNAEMLPYVLESAAWLIESLQASAPGARRVLDLGCGTGRDMAWLESRGANVTGADLSAGMLAQARRVTRGPLCQLDMRSLPFVGGSFAAVWCQAALLHLPKALAPAALTEIRRVLVPGGVLHLSVQQGETEGLETRPYEPVERFYAHYQPEELSALLRVTGFTIVRQGQAEARRIWLYTGARA